MNGFIRFGLIVVTALLTILPVQAQQALLVVHDDQASNLGTHDVFVRDRLVTLGFTVEIIRASDSSAASANGKDLVFISESVGSSTVTNKFKSVTVPVVTDEAYIFDDMAFTGTTANTDFGTITDSQIVITNSSHPLAAGLNGTVTVYTAAGTLSWGLPSADAIKIASTVGNSSWIALFAYEPGDTLADSTTAAGKRVGFLWHTAGGPLTSAGIALFDAAINWAVAPVQQPTATPTPGPPSAGVEEGWGKYE